ncbi:MAG TPA: ABC transporter substrate-binding protein, partial [Burkholderiales bacterium]|nr:ABC transporter substrate-binding protein [Burkholderiales bacterium]
MKAHLIGVLAASIAFCAQAQQTVFIPIVIEVSGSGAVSGTNFRDGALMAIDEVNAKGGILGRRISAPVSDTQTNPGISRAQVQKALDGNPYAILGPVFSGSVKVNMLLAQAA